MKIGDVELDNNVFLAPMAGITDTAFRLICKKHGCGLVYTEMVSAKGLYHQNGKTRRLLTIEAEEKPVAVQIFGSDPGLMAETAYKLCLDGVEIIDINMGCPTPKIVRNGEGAALMLKPTLVGEIIRKVSGAINVPLTVKIRKGWDQNNLNALEIAHIARENGVAAIAIHGRTREEFYSGKADWSIVEELKKSMDIPVIGNGDIFSPVDAVNMIERTGCDAVMIGRGARGNPWIFSHTLRYMETGQLPDMPDISERIRMIEEHTRLMVSYKGEETAVKEMRKHICWYIKGLKNAGRLRNQVNRVSSIDELLQLLQSFDRENQEHLS